jgi:hypothetical protein
MLFEIDETTLDDFTKQLNKIPKTTELPTSTKCILFCDRQPRAVMKLLMCGQNQWNTFYQFAIVSENNKSNIDIICNFNIPTQHVDRLCQSLTRRDMSDEVFQEIFCTIRSTSAYRL